MRFKKRYICNWKRFHFDSWNQHEIDFILKSLMHHFCKWVAPRISVNPLYWIIMVISQFLISLYDIMVIWVKKGIFWKNWRFYIIKSNTISIRRLQERKTALFRRINDIYVYGSVQQKRATERAWYTLRKMAFNIQLEFSSGRKRFTIKTMAPLERAGKNLSI